MLASDAALVVSIGAAAPDAAAAEAELCRRYAPRVRLYGLRHLRDEDRARDLVQAVLLAVLEAARARRISEPEHLDRFVLGTCRNQAARVRDLARRSAPEPAGAGPSTAVLEAAVLPDEARVDTPALFRCLAALDGRARSVLLLSFHDEEPAATIAQQLGTTPGNVRVLRHRALQAVRRCLDGVTS